MYVNNIGDLVRIGLKVSVRIESTWCYKGVTIDCYNNAFAKIKLMKSLYRQGTSDASHVHDKESKHE